MNKHVESLAKLRPNMLTLICPVAGPLAGVSEAAKASAVKLKVTLLSEKLTPSFDALNEATPAT